MTDYTKEPWPVFTDIAVMMTPDPECTPVAVLSWDDYIRARACVNACAGIETERLSHGVVLENAQRVALERWDFKAQRDELLKSLEGVLPFLTGNYWPGVEADAAVDFAVATARKVAAAKVTP